MLQNVCNNNNYFLRIEMKMNDQYQFARKSRLRNLYYRFILPLFITLRKDLYSKTAV